MHLLFSYFSCCAHGVSERLMRELLQRELIVTNARRNIRKCERRKCVRREEEKRNHIINSNIITLVLRGADFFFIKPADFAARVPLKLLVKRTSMILTFSIITLYSSLTLGLVYPHSLPNAIVAWKLTSCHERVLVRAWLAGMSVSVGVT